MLEQNEYFIQWHTLGKRDYANVFYIWDVAQANLERASKLPGFTRGCVQSFEIDGGRCTGTRMAIDGTRNADGTLKKQRA